MTVDPLNKSNRLTCTQCAYFARNYSLGPSELSLLKLVDRVRDNQTSLIGFYPVQGKDHNQSLYN